MSPSSTPSATPPPSPDPPPRRWQRLGLRTQLAVVFGTLIVIVAVLMSLAFGELLRWRIQREAGAQLHTVASNAAKLLSDGLFARTRTVQVMANSADLWKNGLAAPEVSSLLTRVQATQPHNLWIGVSDAKGTVRSATKSMLVGQDVSARPWFQHGLESVYVGDVHPAVLLSRLLPPSNSGEPLRFVDFAAPIRVADRTLGVLAIHGSWDWARETIEDLLPAHAQQQQVALFIFDREGQMIYAPGGQLKPFAPFDQRLPLKPTVRAEADRLKPSQIARPVQWNDSTQRFLTSVVTLPARSAYTDLGWYVVARQPLETAFAPAHDAMVKALAGGLLAALIAAAIAWLAARRLSQDLKRLSHAASAIRRGDVSAEIPQARSSREVAGLSLALHQTIEQLRASHDAMEEQVRVRTQELEQANAELERQARSDPLTGLLNRRGLQSQLAFALALAQRSGRPLSALCLDIDHFKHVNDRYGHDVGDEVLRTLARVLRERLRASDVVARMGGEEFLAILPDTSLEAAAQIAEQLRITLAQTDMGQAGRITTSLGVSALRPGEADASTMLRRGDEALYSAKASGRNQVCSQA